MAELTLIAGSSGMCPWSFHVWVALEEKQLPYEREVVPLPIPEPRSSDLQRRSILGKVPILVHGDLWITESSAISEYLAEVFPAPAHPPLFPADLGERARARQIMSWLRTSSFALREDRPVETVFGRPTVKPLSAKAQHEAAEVVRIASAAVAPERMTIASEWSIADTDLALMLMRLIANGDPVPARLVTYALAQWERQSVRRYLAQLPATS